LCELPGLFNNNVFKTNNFKKQKAMLIVDVKENETIDQALKRFKRKFQQSKVIREIRDRKEFKKPSVVKRNELLKAQYRNHKVREMEL
jgi:small subunit ribosomal protein S21